MQAPSDPNLIVQRPDQSLRIEWRWSKQTGLVWIINAVLLAIIVYAAMHLPTASGAPRDASNILGLGIVGSLFVIGMLVFGAMHFVNRTVIEASKSELICRATPLQFWKSKQIPIGEIDHFVVKESTSKRPAGLLGVTGKDSTFTRVVMRTPSLAETHQMCAELESFYDSATRASSPS